MLRVRSVLEGAAAGRHRVYMSLISIGEALHMTERERGLVEARRTLAAVDQLPLEIEEVSRSTVLEAALVKARFPISYADAFAVVTARAHDGVVMTGGPEFRPLAGASLIAVEWLPRGHWRWALPGPPLAVPGDRPRSPLGLQYP